MNTVPGTQRDVPERTKYMDIMNLIRTGILNGEFPPGARLPGRRRLATQTGVAPGTVATAFNEYQRLGVLHVRPGDGVFVTGDARRLLSKYAVVTPPDDGPAVTRLAKSLGLLVDRVSALETEVAELRRGGPRIPEQR